MVAKRVPPKTAAVPIAPVPAPQTTPPSVTPYTGRGDPILMAARVLIEAILAAAKTKEGHGNHGEGA